LALLSLIEKIDEFNALKLVSVDLVICGFGYLVNPLI